jgi:hypothetical protein
MQSLTDLQKKKKGKGPGHHKDQRSWPPGPEAISQNYPARFSFSAQLLNTHTVHTPAQNYRVSFPDVAHEGLRLEDTCCTTQSPFPALALLSKLQTGPLWCPILTKLSLVENRQDVKQAP